MSPSCTARVSTKLIAKRWGSNCTATRWARAELPHRQQAANKYLSARNHSPSMMERPIFVICVAVLLFGVGCGRNQENRGAISGEVRLDGMPLQQGSILFTPIDGTKGVVTGGPIENGRYQISGASGPVLGKNRVEIRALRKSGKMVQKALAPQGDMVEGFEEAIAPRFNSKSTLEVEVARGANIRNFEITSR
jgi:hypothetical protein